MKKLLLVALLGSSSMVQADLLPSYPTVMVSTEVTLENASSFDENIAILLCSFSMSGKLMCHALKDNESVSAGYKFNDGPYLFGIEKRVLKKLGGAEAFDKEPLKEGMIKLLKGKLFSTIGYSSSSYQRKDAIHTKDSSTKMIYEITKIENGRLYFRLKDTIKK